LTMTLMSLAVKRLPKCPSIGGIVKYVTHDSGNYICHKSSNI